MILMHHEVDPKRQKLQFGNVEDRSIIINHAASNSLPITVQVQR